MTTSQYNLNTFCGRLGSFAGLYIPRLQKQVAIYLLVSFVCALLSLIPAHETLQMGLFVMIWTLLPLLYYCAPLIFAKGADSRILDRLLPVTAGEKLLFFYAYIIVVMAASVFLFPWIAGLIYINCPSIQNPELLLMYKMKFSFFGMLNLINIIGAPFIAAVCFYCVEYARQNRLLWGIVGVIGANAFLGFLGAIVGGVAAFSKGYEDGINGVDPNESSQQMVQTVLSELQEAEPLSIAILILVIAGMIVTAVLTYRVLRRRNL